ncbi:vWA domain-containing protein [Deltaproteobacteria bacterium TL4]
MKITINSIPIGLLIIGFTFLLGACEKDNGGETTIIREVVKEDSSNGPDVPSSGDQKGSISDEDPKKDKSDTSNNSDTALMQSPKETDTLTKDVSASPQLSFQSQNNTNINPALEQLSLLNDLQEKGSTSDEAKIISFSDRNNNTFSFSLPQATDKSPIIRKGVTYGNNPQGFEMITDNFVDIDFRNEFEGPLRVKIKYSKMPDWVLSYDPESKVIALQAFTFSDDGSISLVTNTYDGKVSIALVAETSQNRNFKVGFWDTQIKTKKNVLDQRKRFEIIRDNNFNNTTISFKPYLYGIFFYDYSIKYKKWENDKWGDDILVKQASITIKDDTLFQFNIHGRGLFEISIEEGNFISTWRTWKQQVYVPYESLDQEQEIAIKYLPIVVFNDEEEYFPMKLEAILSSGAENEAIRVGTYDGGDGVTMGETLMEYMKYMGDSNHYFDFETTETQAHVYADYVPFVELLFLRDQTGNKEEPVVYYETFQVNSRLFLSYYFFYAFDPKVGTKNNPDTAAHAFDRESFTIELDPVALNPISITMGAHLPEQIMEFRYKEGKVYTPKDCASLSGDEEPMTTWEGGRVKLPWKDTLKQGNHPVVYLARGAHAVYPLQGCYKVLNYRSDKNIVVLSEPAGSENQNKILTFYPLKLKKNLIKFNITESEFLNYSGAWVDMFLKKKGATFPPFWSRTPPNQWVSDSELPFHDCVNKNDLSTCTIKESIKSHFENTNGKDPFRGVKILTETDQIVMGNSSELSDIEPIPLNKIETVFGSQKIIFPFIKDSKYYCTLKAFQEIEVPNQFDPSHLCEIKFIENPETQQELILSSFFQDESTGQMSHVINHSFTVLPYEGVISAHWGDRNDNSTKNLLTVNFQTVPYNYIVNYMVYMGDSENFTPMDSNLIGIGNADGTFVKKMGDDIQYQNKYIIVRTSKRIDLSDGKIHKLLDNNLKSKNVILPPTAKIKKDPPSAISINAEDTMVILDGTVSDKGSADVVFYSWSLDSIPDDSSILLSSFVTTDPFFGFRPDVVGIYTISLTVRTQGTDLTSTITANVIAKDVEPVESIDVVGSVVQVDGSVDVSLLPKDKDDSITQLQIEDVAGNVISLNDQPVESSSVEINQIINRVAQTNQTIGAIIVIDDSGSMSQNDPSDKRYDAAKVFVDSFNENFKISVRQLNQGLIQNFTSDKNILKTAIDNNHRSDGGTPLYGATESGLDELIAHSADVKVILILTDGVAGDTSLKTGVVEKANNNGIAVFTVGLGQSSSIDANFQSLSSETGCVNALCGVYSQLDDPAKLAKTFGNIGEAISIGSSTINFTAIFNAGMEVKDLNKGDQVIVEIIVLGKSIEVSVIK